MTTRKKRLLAVATILWIPIVAVLSYGYLYQPLKYRYLIWRVESARTSSEERAAFTVAANWGRVWDVRRIQSEDAFADGRQISGDWLLRLEWLHSSPYRGGAYVAYRAVTDTNNLQILTDKRY